MILACCHPVQYVHHPLIFKRHHEGRNFWNDSSFQTDMVKPQSRSAGDKREPLGKLSLHSQWLASGKAHTLPVTSFRMFYFTSGESARGERPTVLQTRESLGDFGLRTPLIPPSPCLQRRSRLHSCQFPESSFLLYVFDFASITPGSISHESSASEAHRDGPTI